MDKFKLQSVPKSFLKRKMRDIFNDLIDTDVVEADQGYLKSMPSNYGFISLHYWYLNDDALEKYMRDYVKESKKLKEIETAKANQGESFDLSRALWDYLLPIARDHPDILRGGIVKVLVAVLLPDFQDISPYEAPQLLQQHAKRLKKLNAFADSITRTSANDAEIRFETIKFIDPKKLKSLDKFEQELLENALCYEEEDYDEHAQNQIGCELELRIDFNADDVLGELLEKIDETIAPIKGILDQMIRYEGSYSTFV